MSTNPDGNDPNARPDTGAPGTSPESQETQNSPGEAASVEQQAREQASATSTDPAQRIAELEGQIADLTDRLLRAHAEMDNFRKRVDREKSELAKFAISKFALDMVGITDNFERAISSVPQQEVETDAVLKGLVEGIEMTERAFQQALERHGVKRLTPDGEQFDPHRHQAVLEQDNPGVAAGTVLQVFQAGYVIDDRVLRPAMVVVAKGGPKAQATDDEVSEPPADSPEAGDTSGSETGASENGTT